MSFFGTPEFPLSDLNCPQPLSSLSVFFRSRTCPSTVFAHIDLCYEEFSSPPMCRRFLKRLIFEFLISSFLEWLPPLFLMYKNFLFSPVSWRAIHPPSTPPMKRLLLGFPKAPRPPLLRTFAPHFFPPLPSLFPSNFLHTALGLLPGFHPPDPPAPSCLGQYLLQCPPAPEVLPTSTVFSFFRD